MNSVEILETQGYEPHLAYFGADDSVIEAMQIFWGNRLAVFPYTHPSVTGNFQQRWRARFRKYLPPGNYALKQNAWIDDWFDLSIKSSFQKWINELNPDTIICHYVWISKLLEWVPTHIRKVIDTHDRFTDRFKVAAAAGKANDWFSTSLSNEIRGLRRADAVIAICEEDHRFFQNELGLESYYHAPYSPVFQCPSTSEKSIFFVGNQNSANQRAIEWFFENCWGNILAEVPDAVFRVAGSVCDTFDEQRQTQKLGRIDNITAAYEESKVSINPVPAGSGIAIKCLESLSHQRPVVATPSGARGLDLFVNKCLFIEEEPETFCSQIIQLLHDLDRYRAASQACKPLLEQWNEHSRSQLIDAISSPQ